MVEVGEGIGIEHESFGILGRQPRRHLPLPYRADAAEPQIHKAVDRLNADNLRRIAGFDSYNVESAICESLPWRRQLPSWPSWLAPIAANQWAPQAIQTLPRRVWRRRKAGCAAAVRADRAASQASQASQASPVRVDSIRRPRCSWGRLGSKRPWAQQSSFRHGRLFRRAGASPTGCADLASGGAILAATA